MTEQGLSKDAKRRRQAYRTGARDAIDDLRETLIPEIKEQSAKIALNRLLDKIAKKYD